MTISVSGGCNIANGTVTMTSGTVACTLTASQEGLSLFRHEGQGRFSQRLIGKGSSGSKPTHPELLDWLAATLIENHWSLKSLHKQIVMSAVYRQASHHPHEPQMMDNGMKADPTARLLWRFPIRRLSAEQIRDSMLAAAGELDLRSGGPGADLTSGRRSVYLKSMRNTHEPLLEAFDQPDRITGTGSRNVTARRFRCRGHLSELG